MIVVVVVYIVFTSVKSTDNAALVKDCTRTCMTAYDNCVISLILAQYDFPSYIFGNTVLIITIFRGKFSDICHVTV